VSTVERSDIRGLVTTVSFPSGAFLILPHGVLAAQGGLEVTRRGLLLDPNIVSLAA
jgi:hypothetical protein